MFVVKNETKTDTTVTCFSVRGIDSDWFPDESPIDVLGDGMKIPASQMEERRFILVSKPLRDGRYGLLFKFDDGSEDKFLINHAWACKEASLDHEQIRCDHVVSIGRDPEKNSLYVTLTNTAMQILAYKCENTIKKSEIIYKEKGKAAKAESAVTVALADIEKILQFKCCKGNEDPDEHPPGMPHEDYAAKKIANRLLKPANILMARIKEELSENYKMMSINSEIEKHRDISWRNFYRSERFLNMAIDFAKTGEDTTLEKNLNAKLQRYDKKRVCNEKFNNSLKLLEVMWQDVVSFKPEEKNSIDPHLQNVQYRTKYEQISVACDRSDAALEAFKEVKDKFDELIKLDKDYQYCEMYTNDIMTELKNFLPKLRMIQLQTALQGLEFPKFEMKNPLWSGEEYVEINGKEFEPDSF